MTTKELDQTGTEAPVVEDEAQAQADFDAGVEMEETGVKTPPRDESGRFVAPGDAPAAKAEDKSAGKPAAKAGEKPAAAKPGEKPDAKTEEKPEYVQITKAQFEKMEAAVTKTEEFEKQFSKVFGTVGDMQKILRGLQAQTPRGAAVKIPPGAFDAMKKDFPELAEHMQATMEAILKDVEGTGTTAADPEAFEKAMEERVLKMAAEDLADEFPDWQKIVGAVDTRKGEQPDPNNAFRKWLATKPQEYQDRVNNTNSSGVITRAIRLFKSDEKAAKAATATAKPNGQAAVRASRISDAVRPKSDGGPPPGPNAEDDFESGFKTG